MPVPSSIADLSQTANSNSPAGSESPNTADDYLRTYASYIAQHRDGAGFTQEATVASAATADIGAATSMYVQITGTTTITSFGTAYNGPRFVRFAGALTLTHNATTLILPGGANITTAAGDTVLVVPNGNAASGWRVVAYQTAAGGPVNNAITTTKIADANVTPAKLANSGAELGARNKIINGSMVVDQRNAGASQTFTAGGALAYCVDRWYGYCTGANVTGQQITTSGLKRWRFTGAASVTGVGFGQRIESANCVDLAGQTAVLSVKLSSSSLTSITWTAYYATSTDSFGTLASPTRTQIATGTFTINSTEATYSASMSVSSSATTGIEIVFTGGALLGTQTLTIGDVQLERGSTATPFEVRSYGTELQLAQRYLPAFNSTGTVSQIGVGMIASAAVMTLELKHPAPTRVPPTGVSVSSAAHITVYTTGVNTVATSIGSINTSNTLSSTIAVSASGWTSGQGAYAYFNNAAGQLLLTGCEL